MEFAWLEVGPSRQPTERTGFLDDNRERLWERVHAKQRRFLLEHFRCDRNLCKGTHKEHTPSTFAMNVDSSPEYFLKAEKDTSKWKYMCLEDDVWCNEDAWEFLLEAYAEAVSNMEAQWVKKSKECEEKKPWNWNFDHDALRRAYNASVEDNQEMSCVVTVQYGRGTSVHDGFETVPELLRCADNG